MPTVKENERLARRITDEIFQKQNFDVIDELFAEDYVVHDPSMPEPIRGRDGFRQMVERGARIVDGTIDIDQIIATDDWVVTRWIQQGVHTGKIARIEPTNNEVTVTGIDISRVKDGKVAESWQEVNLMNMLLTIGAVPEDLFTADFSEES